MFKRICNSIFDLGGLRKFYLVGYVSLLVVDVLIMSVRSVSFNEVLFRVCIYCLSWLIIQFLDHKYLKFFLVGTVLGVLFLAGRMICMPGYSGVSDLRGGGTAVGIVWLWVNFAWIVFVFWLGIYLSRWFQDRGKNGAQLLFVFLLTCGYVLIVGVSLWCNVYSYPFLLIYTGFLLGLVTRWFERLVAETSEVRPGGVGILGVKVGNWSMDSCIREIGKMIEAGGFHRVVTPYSEFFVRAWEDELFMKTLNTADISVPDGVFVHWATSYLSIPISTFFPVRVLHAVLGYVFSGAGIVLYPEYTHRVIKERVSGSAMIYPLCELAAKKGYSVFFVGGQDWGRGNAGVLAAEVLRKKYKGLNIVGVYPGRRKKESREEALRLINKCKPDIVCVCFGGGAGELWLYENRSRMKCKIAIGLGGTFDFIAGYADETPTPCKKLGLEWFVRPFSRERGGLLNNVKRGYRVWRGMLKSSILVLVFRLKSDKGVDL